MRIRRTAPRPTVAFLFEPDRALHVPARCEWADALRVDVRGGDWSRACASLPEGVDVTLGIDAGDAAGALRDAPGLRVAVVLDAARGQGAVDARAAAAVDAFTWPVGWAAPGVPPFQVLPPPLDEARFAEGPRLARGPVLLAGWAEPPAALRDRLGSAAHALAATATLREVADAAPEAAVLVACTGGPPLAPDPRLLVALARGLLVVSDAPPPPDWSLDVGDDLVVAAPGALADIVDRALQDPLAFAAIRVRAWQRVRESFSSAAFERLVADARNLLARGAREGAP